LVRQLLTETFLLAGSGATLGILLAESALRTIRALGAAGVPRMSEASMNAPVLGLALCVTATTTVLCGLVPALQSAQLDLQTALRQAGRGLVGSFQDRARRIYIGAQVALALTLLSAAGLLIRSALAADNVDLGFVPLNVTAARTALPPTTYRDAATIARTYNRILESLASTPGVVSAALASKIPLGTSGAGLVLKRDAVSHPLKEDVSTELHYISPGYFAAMRIRLVSGREFSTWDRAGNRQVVIVSEGLARKLWPGTRAIGQALRLPELQGDTPLWEVVGIAADVHVNGTIVPAPPVLYIPFLQVSINPWHWTENSMYLIARVHHGISSASAIEAAVHAVDLELPISDMRSMEDRVARSISFARLYGLLMSGFGICGLILTSAGIYGVVSYFVARQRPNIGVRVALGATRRQIIGVVLRQGMRPVAVGMLAGFAASFASSPLLASQLYGVKAVDPLTLLTVAAVLLTIAMLACYIPARQASRVDPLVALRSE
jgi:predicted permease